MTAADPLPELHCRGLSPPHLPRTPMPSNAPKLVCSACSGGRRLVLGKITGTDRRNCARQRVASPIQ